MSLPIDKRLCKLLMSMQLSPKQKITYPEDIIKAEALIKHKSKD